MILLFSLIIALMSGCDKGPTEADDKDYAVYAKVVDSNNNPLSDVNFHYIFYTGSNIVTRNISYSFQLQSNDTVTIKVFNSLNKEVSTLLNNESIMSGNYTYFFDASIFTNGIYTCRINGLTIDKEIKSFAITDDITKLLTVDPLLKSDADGSLSISFANLGIGNKYFYQNGINTQEYQIADSIKIILHKEGYKTFTEVVKLDITKDYSRTFILESN